MSLKQLELRCTSNTVHYVLNKEHTEDQLLNSNELKKVLSKTPKFRPTPSIIKPRTVATDCDLFGHRIIKTFNRFVCNDFIQQAKVNSKLAGIVPWKPKQFPHPQDFYARHNQDFFDTSKPSGFVWKTQREKCPRLEHFIASFKRDTVNKSANIAKRRLRIKPNLLPKERYTLRMVLNRNIGFNNSDKNFGPVLYSRDLYLKQCQMHLFDNKGTYEYTEKPRDLILLDLVRRLKNLLNDSFGNDPSTKSLARTLTKWADDSLKRNRLANFYVIWKLHKKANAQGVRSRPISNNIGYPTGQVSHFLHSQLIDSVNAHVHVLKDSLSLIRQLESMSFSPEQNILLTSADVAALYPSINIEDGMKALQWFMAKHSSIPQNLQPKYLKLARFVLENNYIECKDMEGSFLQKIGTAMGTSFSVTYTTIFMIWLETPIIDKFRKHILLYKRYIDDIFLIWSGSSAELCRFRERFGNANDNIKLEWQGTPSAVDAINPAKFDQHQHRQVNFLDLDITIVYSPGSADFDFKVYRKPGTAYAYLPYGSYHARHVFRGWLKAEMHRLLTHSSSPAVWLEECGLFYKHLRKRGYPTRAIDSTFRSINWNQRSKMLEPRKRVADDKFFAQYRACVFSNRNAPGSAELRVDMDLSLEELREQGQGRDIFPPRAFFALRSALPMGHALPR
jgi:hypothetical protein